VPTFAAVNCVRFVVLSITMAAVKIIGSAESISIALFAPAGSRIALVVMIVPVLSLVVKSSVKTSPSASLPVTL
jgi:hypothetical protein